MRRKNTSPGSNSGKTDSEKVDSGKALVTDKQVSNTRYFHPYLIALFPAANLYAANWTAVELKGLLLPLLAVLATAAIFHALAKWVCSDAEKAAIVASWTIAWFFSYAALQQLLDFVHRKFFHGASSLHGEYILAAWGILWLLVAAWIYKTSRRLAPMNSFLTSAASMLLAISVISLGFQWFGKGHTPKQEASDTWVQPLADLVKPSQPRDIYFLVFDRYGGQETLRRKFQLDNADFLDQLRLRGFGVSPESCSSYPRSILSICSTLNLSYLPEDSHSDSYYSRMIDNHLVGRSLKKLGYEYHHLGNWYQPFRTNRNATQVYSKSLLPSEYADTLYAKTPLSKIVRGKSKYDLVMDKFEQVAKIAKIEAPTFVYAHFLVPHPPYVLERDGSKIAWSKTRYGDPKEGYAKQLEGTNKLILEMVDKILEDSEQVPIILLQADEGPYLSEADRSLDRKLQLLTRARILSAFLLPNPGGEGDEFNLPESLFPVNTFRLIFREYFGADIELLPNRTYSWEVASPLGLPTSDNKRYVDVTSLIVE